MIRASVVLLLIAASACQGAYISDILPFKPVNDDNGGIPCAGCSIGLSLVSQLSTLHGDTVAETLSKICGWFPVEMRDPCNKIVTKFGPSIIKFLAERLSPDEACLKMGVCKNPQCRLFPATTEHGARLAAESAIFIPKEADDWSLTPWDWLKKEVDKVFNTHEPLIDFDGDLFSTTKTFRGSSWRGKDCNDGSKLAHPGRADDGDDAHTDNNCNGISGVDTASGRSYEDLYCNGTDPHGIVILGDSAAAHFHIPMEYLNPPSMNSSTFSELLFVLENEFDWPQQSSSTAYMAVADKFDQGPISSLYGHLYKHNRCIHRDFQNVGVNGARANAMIDIVKSMQRDPTVDRPLIVMYALIGNDVCNGHPDYWNRMTKPEDFRRDVLIALEYLDTVLPHGSHVMLTGLADGRILYDVMSDLIHPIGAGVKYSAVYDYLNCLELSPCLVWMNSNSTIRDAGSARAAELNDVYAEIVSNSSIHFNNFDLAYYDLPIAEAIAQHVAAGGDKRDLIEPIDGFHPSQVAMALIADIQWQRIVNDHPDWIGSPNPNNDKIEKMFGDQGGY